MSTQPYHWHWHPSKKRRRGHQRPRYPEPTDYFIDALGGQLEMVVFDKLPLHDSTWGLCTGVDGLVYIAACGETTGGLSVFILSYDPKTRKVDYRIEVGPALGCPPDDGHATQSKIHYCLLPGSDGLLYCATHASGAPLGDPWWSPYQTWYDPVKNFPGSHFFTFDPRTDTIDDHGVLCRREGCRCMALDERRRKVYGITWPRNHLFSYDYHQRRYVDLGRIGDKNPQAIWLDGQGRAYTTDDFGAILRVDGDKSRLEQLPIRLPHEAYRRGWHNVAYDVVPSPDGQVFYGTDWGYESHLWRHDPSDGPDGRIDDLGRPPIWPEGFRNDYHLEMAQLRGLVFGADGLLYYAAASFWEAGRPLRYLMRMNVATGHSEVVAKLLWQERPAGHIASGTPDFYGNLYFAEAGHNPTRMLVYRPADVDTDHQRFSWKDIKPWG